MSVATLNLEQGRVIAYALTEADGHLDDYTVRAIAALRPFADRLVVVIAGTPLDDDARRRLSDADEILDAPMASSVAAAYRVAAQAIQAGGTNLTEALFVTDGWFGPIGGFADTISRMSARAADFWTMTDHGKIVDHAGVTVAAHYHQWHWLAVTPRVLASSAWRQFWDGVSPTAPRDDDAQLEQGLSAVLVGAGLKGSTAFAAADAPTANPSVLNAQLLVEQGCPILRARPFSDWPPYLAHEASVGAWVLQAPEEKGYPASEILSHLARTVPPKVLNADAALLNVLSEEDVAFDHARPPRVVVVAHIFYDDMTDELLDRAETLPVPFDLVVTTHDIETADRISQIVAARPNPPQSVDVRVVESNAGRDQSAFLIGCRDIILSDEYDLIVKIHSKKSVADGPVVGAFFKDQQLSNLLNSPGYTANLLALFQREPGLGLVFPPMIHIGMPTMGRGWSVNKPRFAPLAARLGIRVPLDDVSPLAPYGSMYVARPAALRPLVASEWTFAEFAADGYGDGSLAHTLERMPAYAAGAGGMHARTVTTREYMSISHTALDFKLDQMAATTPGYLDEQIAFLKRAGFWGDAKAAQLALMTVRLHHPEWETATRRFFEIGPRARHLSWRLRHPSTWRKTTSPR